MPVITTIISLKILTKIIGKIGMLSRLDQEICVAPEQRASKIVGMVLNWRK